jgi:hypothetical protein
MHYKQWLPKQKEPLVFLAKIEINDRAEHFAVSCGSETMTHQALQIRLRAELPFSTTSLTKTTITFLVPKQPSTERPNNRRSQTPKTAPCRADSARDAPRPLGSHRSPQDRRRIVPSRPDPTSLEAGIRSRHNNSQTQVIRLSTRSRTTPLTWTRMRTIWTLLYTIGSMERAQLGT